MKTDRNKNNLKSEENMILKKSRRSDANVFPAENRGIGKFAKAKKTGKRCDLENSSAAEMAVYGYCFCCSRRSGNGSYPAADPGKIVDTVTAGKAVTFWVIFLYFAMLALTGFMESARKVCLPYLGRKSHMHLEAALWKNSYALLLTN